jgi:hypothetical protein
MMYMTVDVLNGEARVGGDCQIGGVPGTGSTFRLLGRTPALHPICPHSLLIPLWNELYLLEQDSLMFFGGEQSL